MQMNTPFRPVLLSVTGILDLALIVAVLTVSDSDRRIWLPMPGTAAVLGAVSGATTRFPDYDENYPPTEGSTPVFRLSQDYPTSIDEAEQFPWIEQQIDVRKEWFRYLKVVYDYCLEGNIAESVDFAGELNPVRKWYHAPWMHGDGHKGGNGREFHYGLTRERHVPRYELHHDQRAGVENWAIGIYNARAAYTLGKVWNTATGFPDPTQAAFAPNSVAFKLLFTDATDTEAPFLKGSMERTANIYERPANGGNEINPASPRIDRTVRLLQIDIAVRDTSLNDASGWVFGTYMYDASAPGTTVWEKMVPVGVSWGDDPGITDMMNDDGCFENNLLHETKLNTSLIWKTGQEYGNRAHVLSHGLGGRLKGPVDNPVSSCISCHGRAATWQDAFPLSKPSGSPMPQGLFSKPRKDFKKSDLDRFFKLMKPGAYPFEDTQGKWFVTTDYSLQLTYGIRNFYEYLRFKKITPPAVGAKYPLPTVTRGQE